MSSDKVLSEATAKVVSQAAEKTAKTTEARLKLIKDKIVNATHGYLDNTHDFRDTLINEGIQESVNEVLGKINTYRDRDSSITLAEINEDIVIISAHLTFISGKAGELQGRLTNHEHVKNLIRSRNIVEIKSIAELNGIKSTDAEADNLSRVISEEGYHRMAAIEVALRYLTGIMYSAKFFCEMLDSVAKRLVHEDRL